MEPHLYVLGLGALSLVNAGLAQAKGRSALRWFLATLPLGVVATFLIIVLADRSAPAVQPTPVAVGARPPEQRRSPES